MREQFIKEWLPDALLIGITEKDFWQMTMRTLNAYVEADKRKRLVRDAEMWRMGIYIQSAVSVAVEHNLAGQKAKSEYLEKPLLQDAVEGEKELTEEEKQKQRDLLVAQLKAMQANFEMNHPKKDVG